MATKYAVVSGAWSSTATWSDTDGGAGGAAVPADGDAVVISAGVSVLMDVNQSAFVTGIAGVTIRGAAVTPGMLYFKDGTNGYLKIKASTTIRGTNAAVYGRILANSDGVWENTGELSISNSATIYLLTSAFINAQYLTNRFYCHQPTTKYVEVYKNLNICTPVAGTNNFSTGTAHGFVNASSVKFRVSAGGSLPSPLVVGYIYVVNVVNTTTFSLRYYPNGAIIPITDSGSGTFEVYDGITAAQGSTINVLTDVSTDTDWTNAVDRNNISLCNSFSDDREYLNIASTAPGTVTLSAAPNSTQYAGSLIILCYRNVRVISNSTVASVNMINHGSTVSAADCVYQCELHSVTGTGYGIRATNFDFKGLSWACYAATTVSTDVVMSGITIGGYGAGHSDTRLTVTGLIANAPNGMRACTDSTFSGTNCGCLSLFTECTRCNAVDATIIGIGNTGGYGVYQSCTGGLITNCNINYCYSVFVQSFGQNFASGSMTGISYPVHQSSHSFISSNVSIVGSIAVFNYSDGQCNAEISNCNSLSYRSSVEFNNISPSSITLGTVYSKVRFRNSTLTPASPVSSYLFRSNDHNTSVLSIDEGGVARQLRGWNSGGLITTEDYISGTHGTPPATLDLIYKFAYEADYSNGIDILLMGRRNVPTRIKVYMKKSVNSMTATPYVKLCSQNYGFEQSGEQLAIATMVDNTDWQTLVVEYTPTYDMPLTLRIAGKNATGITYWNWEQCSSSSWGNTLLGG